MVGGFNEERECVHVCVCVCVREKETKSARELNPYNLGDRTRK